MEGVQNVLKLRAQFEGGTPAAPEKYIDLSYYQKALAGLKALIEHPIRLRHARNK